MSEKRDEQGKKKSYAKPEVKQVPLRPEEAVLGGCKGTGEGAVLGTCGVTCPNVGT